ncbi:hypothetical protein Tco_0051052, partial [Tanacetum coccineum]
MLAAKHDVSHERLKRKPLSRAVTANKAIILILNSFDVLSTLVDEEEQGGNQTPSTNATRVVAKINELGRQMLDGKLMLVDEHGKSLEMN